MIELSGNTYLWVKALHVIGVITWMAGLFYLPRLYVYHCAAAPGSEQSETFKTMERRLLRAIINPAMIAAFVFGLILLANLPSGAWIEVWLWIKLVFVIALAAYHGMLSRWRRDFEADRNERTAKFYRIANEVPTIAVIVIVIAVVVKPF
jgi:putative membrane protein